MIDNGTKLCIHTTFLTAIASGETGIRHYSDVHLSIIASGEIYNASYTDLALYLATAYRQWGKQLPAQLYGAGWWFIIYDKQTGEIFAAVEQYGDTSLYYAVVENHLYIARNLADFRKAIPVSTDFNYIINGMVSTTLNNVGATHFKEVFYLPLGHTLSYADGRLKIEKYWFPEHIAERPRKNKEALYEELYTLYQEAVAKRLKGAQNPAALLSGGLDSGSVVTLAAEILAGRNQSLHTVSHVPKYTDIQSIRPWVNDESPQNGQVHLSFQVSVSYGRVR